LKTRNTNFAEIYETPWEFGMKISKNHNSPEASISSLPETTKLAFILATVRVEKRVFFGT